MAYDTAGNIINQVAIECGLAAVSDPYAETDQNFVQLRYLLKSLGADLWRAHQWTHLLHTKAFSTFSGIAQYDLPLDFGAMVDQTGWNRTNRLPLGGPVSSQQWQYLKARLVGVVFTVLFRPLQGQLWIYPDTNTPEGFTIAFEYLSRYWVRTAAQVAALDGVAYQGDWTPVTDIGDSVVLNNNGRNYVCTNPGTSAGAHGALGPTGTSTGIADGTVTWDYLCDNGTEEPTASTDVVQFEPQLVRRGLKVLFLQAKGFDSSAAQNDYDRTLEQCIGDDSASPVLRLGDGNGWQEPLLGERNIPITGFGS